PATRGTTRSAETSRPAAVGARLGKHHVTPCRFHDARPVTGRAAGFVDVQPADAAAHAAMFLPRDRDGARPATDRVLERDGYRLTEVNAAFEGVVRWVVALPEHVGEEITERGRFAAVHADREIESFETERGTGLSLVRGTRRVVATPAIGVDERLVGLRDLP